MKVYDVVRNILSALFLRRRAEKVSKDIVEERRLKGLHSRVDGKPVTGQRRGIPTPAYFKRPSQSKRRRLARRIGAV